MIDYRNRLIFIHVPRTGGTSMVLAMGRLCHPDWRLEHLSWLGYRTLFPDLWRTFRKVAVRRDPETHRRSWYDYHRMRFADQMQPDNYAPYACSYEEWVERGCPWHEDWTPCHVAGSPLDQESFIGPPDEGVTVLPFATLAESWGAYIRRAGLPDHFADLPHVNGGPTR